MKSNASRKSIALVVLALLAATGTASAEEARIDTDAPVYTITIHDLPDPASVLYPPFQAWFDHHPNVRAIRHSQLAIRTLERGSLMMSIAGGTAPDILRVYHHEAKSWIRNGFFEQLDKYIYKDTNGDGRYTHGVDEVIWKPFLNMPDRVREFVLEDGHIYILPRFQWIQFLVYRKDLFADAGLDPEKRFETFEDLVHASEVLTDPNARIPGARKPVGRKGIGIMPNGWIWQGWLYGCGGESLHYVKTCPKCGTETRFPQNELKWSCSKCGNNLKAVPGRERASLDSPQAHRALKLWHDLMWAPFTKCPHCKEPVGLGDAKVALAFPLQATCGACKKSFTLQDESKVIHGAGRACIDESGDWMELFLNGEIAIMNYYLIDWIADSNIDPTVVGIMPFPEHGGASAHHYYGIYAGARKRPGGEERVRACADMILDFCSQFYVPKGSPDYLKYEKEQARKLVDAGFYNLCSYDELVAAGLEEYAKEIPPTSREMQRLIRDPDHYVYLPMSEGYSRVQQEILSFVLLSRICTDPNYDIDENLQKANTLANTQVFMKDEIVKESIERYRWVVILIVILLIAFVAYLVRNLLMKGEHRLTNPLEKKLSFGKRTASALMLLPAVLLILTWAYYPLIRGSVMAFEDVKVMGGSRWVGIENFIRVVTNPLFPTVIKATVIYVLATLILGFMAPVFLAILLAEARRGSTVYRAIYYAPYLLGGVVVLFIWRLFYLPTDEGLLNHVLGWFNLGPVRWLEDPSINKWMLAIPGIWAGTGSACLVYLAALKSIDDEMYEAAEIDGAGTWSKIFNITLPCLKPLLIINFVGAFIGAFHGMGNILVLTGGAFDTNVIGLQIFLEAFGYLRFGSATALAWVLGSVLIGFTVYQLSFLRKVEFRRAQ